MIQKLITNKPKDENEDWIEFIPIFVPDFQEVRRLVFELHQSGKDFRGEAFGWPVYYSAKKSEEDWSFCQVGTFPHWSINFDWEFGDDQEPIVIFHDKNLVRETRKIDCLTVLAAHRIPTLDRLLWVTFSDRQEKRIDLSWLHMDDKIFYHFKVDPVAGTIVWPNRESLNAHQLLEHLS